ncbi:hypothetical protein EC957_006740 [Mortierella hygrophila]|uniref:Uncharacterized protein n=1 Tax=Mortierella hygrophila TaxID=979708 RepID=A0A9P6JYZ2_9FUNG|nr:hypothetical protein EC957_006740 [Mortierella hygrophila]
MKYAFITFAIVMMAAALSSSSNSHVGALPRRLIKRAVTVAQCFTGLPTNLAFDDSCKDLFLPGKGFRAVTSITLAALDLDFSDPDPLKIILSSPDMKVGVISNLPIPITGTRQDVTLVDNGVNIATFSTPWVPGVMKGNLLETTVGSTTLNVNDTQRDQFSAFIASLTINTEHNFTLKGTVDVNFTLPTPFGTPVVTTITGIYFESIVTLKGFANFPDIQFVELIEKTENTDNSFTIKSKVNIKSASQLGVKMGDVQFHTFDAVSSEAIGVTVLEQLNLVPGDNFIIAVTTSTSATTKPQDIFKRVSENGEIFRLEGFSASSTTDPILSNGIAVVKTNVTIPALNTAAPAA